MAERNNEFTIKERKRWLFFGLPFTFTTYQLTNKKLNYNRGLFTSLQDEILLYRITDISLTRTLFQKMFGLGSLKVTSTDKSHSELILKNIKNSAKFREILSDAIEKDRLRMKYRTGEFIGGDSDEVFGEQ